MVDVPGGDEPSLRASDADRERALDVMSGALSAGQLTPEEHGDRVRDVLEAKTVDDLRRLTSDLVPGARRGAGPASSPAGWYPDPEHPGFQRYFDGAAWTPHRAPLPGPYGTPWWGRPPWKGAQLGLPASGPGALADPARRLGARLLDGLVLLPVAAGMVTLAVVLVAPHAGPILPRVTEGQSATATPAPGLIWIELAVVGALVATGLVVVAYEAVATARYGRTLGKAWLHIRPLRTDGRALGWARAFGRPAISWLAGLCNWVGLLDPLWCLWDDNRQCLHDKAAGTVVVNDPVPAGLGAGDASGGAVVQSATAPAWAPYQLPAPPPQHGYWGGPPAAPRTNGAAIGSLVCSLSGILFAGVPAIAGVILGFVARTQIRRPGRTQRGGGMAVAGIVVGCCVIAFWVAVFVSAN